MIYLVRHGHAGTKHKWPGPDQLRPLSETGRRESRGLLDRLSGRHISAIISSPSRRCLQTVAGLSQQRSLPVRIDQRLAAAAHAEDTLALLLAEDQADAVLCTHGEVISAVFDELRLLGAPIDANAEWAKGSTWLLDIIGGTLMDATYLPPLTRPSAAGFAVGSASDAY